MPEAGHCILAICGLLLHHEDSRRFLSALLIHMHCMHARMHELRFLNSGKALDRCVALGSIPIFQV